MIGTSFSHKRSRTCSRSQIDIEFLNLDKHTIEIYWDCIKLEPTVRASRARMERRSKPVSGDRRSGYWPEYNNCTISELRSTKGYGQGLWRYNKKTGAPSALKFFRGVEEYCERHTTALTELHERLLSETEEKTTTANFLVGDLEGAFLKMLVRMTRAKSILEVGMFTGYSALCFAEVLPADGRIITCELDPHAIEIGRCRK